MTLTLFILLYALSLASVYIRGRHTGLLRGARIAYHMVQTGELPIKQVKP